MRLKTLHHQRPISKAEGIVITGNKIDLINDIKTKYHHKIDSMNNDGTKQNTNRSQKHFEQIRQNLASDTSTASYQAIEATYLKHGIIIHILKTTPMVKVTNQNTSSILTSNTKPTFRRKAFLCKKQNCDLQHRSINILQYSMNDETNSESNHAKSLTELETATSIMADDLDKNLILNVSYPVDQGQHSSFDIHSSSIITNEKSEIVEDDRSQLLLLRAQSSVQQDKDEPTKHFTNIKFNEESVQSLSPKQQQQVKEDPDLVYMYNLLKKHTGNSVTDAIRRRAGLRNTFAVHRRLSQNLASGEESNNKSHYNKVLIPYTHSNIDFCPTPTITKLQRRNYDHEHHHQMNVNEYKSFSNITQKKIEKDIVKHASRIRTTQSKEYYSFGSSNNRLASSYTNTNTDSHKRINFNQHQNIKQKTTIHQPSTPISLRPLQLLLSPSPPSSLQQKSSTKPLRSPTLLSNSALPEITITSFNLSTNESSVCQNKTVCQKKLVNSTAKTDLKISSPPLISSRHLFTTSSFNDSLMLSKKELTTVVDTDRHSSSLDSGYDRSDSQSIVSGLSTVPNSSSVRSSARITNSSSLACNKKKVSFGDELLNYL